MGRIWRADELMTGLKSEIEDGHANPDLTPRVADNATFADLCEIEPGLRDIEVRIREVDGSAPHFCANREWYREYKPVLERLVGWYAKRPELRSMAAYDTAYKYLYDLLPACRDCFCL